MKRIQLIAGISAIMFLAGGISVAAGSASASSQKPKAVKATHGQTPVGKAPKPPKPVTGPSKSMDAGKATKTAKQARATTPDKSKKPAKTTKLAKTTTPAKTTKSARATKPATTKLAKAAKPAKATKLAKVTKPAATTKLAKATKPAKTKLAKATKPAKATTKTAKAIVGPSPTSPTTPLTPVQAKLQKNTNLAAKLSSRLPAGTDLMTASAGFRNLGQFVAAVNVSNNLDIPFAQLKAKMVTDGLSLGQSIQTLRPAASGTVEAQRAEYDARGMMADSTPTTTTVSTKSKPKTKKVYRTQIGSQD